MKKEVIGLIYVAAIITASAFALPTHAEIRCPKVVGTYLATITFDNNLEQEEFSSRSIITLRGDGTIDASDSGQQGNIQFDPFGDSKGAYVCQHLSNKAVNIKASLINFTFPGIATKGYTPPGNPQAIARTDYNLIYDTKTHTFEGTFVLYIFTMETNLNNVDNPDPLTNLDNPTLGPFSNFIKGRKMGVVE